MPIFERRRLRAGARHRVAPILLLAALALATSCAAPASAAASLRRSAARRPGRLSALPPPASIHGLPSGSSSSLGSWRAYGRPVGGRAAVYEAELPDPISPSTLDAVAWMDPKLLRATLYSGSTIPGGGPYRHSAPIPASAAMSLVAAFNAGFLMKDTHGGYYTDHRTVVPLRAGAASAVIYSDGTLTVGAWGRDVSMSSNVVAVRQNLNLLVDHGRPVAGLNPNDTSTWGYTLGNLPDQWRSGLGVTRDGALVYVAGPDLNITALARLLVLAGAVRAMELDINTDAVSFATYRPAMPDGRATPSNGTDLIATMVGTPARYFEPWWSRDFFTMSARVGS